MPRLMRLAVLLDGDAKFYFVRFAINQIYQEHIDIVDLPWLHRHEKQIATPC